MASTDTLPALDALNPTQCHLSWTVTLATDQPRDAIDDVFIFVMDDMVLEIEAFGETEAVAPAAAAPVLAGAVLPSAALPSTDLYRTALPIAPALIASTPDRAPPREAVAESAPLRVSESVRVPAERLDELMDRVGELVIAQSRLRQLAAGSLDLQLRSVSEEIERLS